jgi:imidazoleglycerol-phosphate dehydratase
MRNARIERETKETQIQVMVTLDGKGITASDTGVRFLDHMLDAFATHSSIDLEVKARGDLTHHVAEDVALVLGSALNKALGDRAGINRFGHAIVPMDEALAMAAVDLVRRPYASVQLQLEGTMLEDMHREELDHFIPSLSIALEATIHVRIIEGRNDHHKVEAAFKAFSRAFKNAITLDPRRSNQLPTSKGLM